MTKREIELQINFKTALYVSSNYEPDILRISFVDKYMFVGTNDLPIDFDLAVKSQWRRELANL